MSIQWQRLLRTRKYCICIMASQVDEVFCLDSIVHEHQVYKMLWTPFWGEILTVFTSEPKNDHDRHAV